VSPAEAGARGAREDTGQYGPFSLDGLSLLSLDALAERYARGTVPGSVEALEGFGRGRLLRLTGPAGREPFASVFRHVTGAAAFPWQGKRFEVFSPGDGEGVNRLALFGERELFRFRVRLEASLADGGPCLSLDYNRADNPRWLRGLRDELREVAPALFMGPAFARLGRSARPVLYFAVSFRAP
jgi:hypothetical protein